MIIPLVFCTPLELRPDIEGVFNVGVEAGSATGVGAEVDAGVEAGADSVAEVEAGADVEVDAEVEPDPVAEVVPPNALLELSPPILVNVSVSPSYLY